MDLVLVCDGSGGIVFIEKNVLNNLSKEFATALNVVIDVEGRTELVADYSDANWSDVWQQEFNKLCSLCSDGLAFIGLLEDGDYSVNVDLKNTLNNCVGGIRINESSLVVIEAGELVQKILYPQLQVDFVGQIDLSPGTYNIGCDLKNYKDNKLKFSITQLPTLGTQLAVVDLAKRKSKSMQINGVRLD